MSKENTTCIDLWQFTRGYATYLNKIIKRLTMLKCLKSQFTKLKARCNHTTITTRQYALLCRPQETYSGSLHCTAKQAVKGLVLHRATQCEDWLRVNPYISPHGLRVNVRKQFTAGNYPTTATFHCTAEPKIALIQAIKIATGAKNTHRQAAKKCAYATSNF